MGDSFCKDDTFADELLSLFFHTKSHVAKTGDIKHFALIEETAVAKGIRRIVAVTGEEAQEAKRLADSFSIRLDALSKLDFSPQLEEQIKVVSKDLDALQISAARKVEFRDVFNGIKKNFDDRDKARKASEIKEAVEEVKVFMEGEEVGDFVVKVMTVGAGNAKALATAVAHVKTMGTKAVYLLSVDNCKGTVAHSCVVPKVSGHLDTFLFLFFFCFPGFSFVKSFLS